MPNAALYRLINISQTYNGRTILDVPALDIFEGEILGVVGPSGAGKSTLLRLLNFLETPTTGEIIYRGQSVPADPPLAIRREVTTLFQRPQLLRGSVRENVAYGLALRGERADGRVTAALAQVRLKTLENAAARTLSGGEMQRVALARALVLEPRVLLLDEPTANLDPFHVGLMEDLVREQNRARGVTVVVVTHNLFQARRLADRVALLLNGNLVEIAPSATFFDTPQDPRTSAFVRGEMVY